MQSFRIFTETALCEKCGKVHEGECDVTEMGPAAMKRAKRRKASLDKAMKKYGDAEKMGMNPADVNQRRNKPTLKKK
jgi:molybdenum-dependent DNA-binding transcriptional regulator ModE|tara:strand:- start:259 stop:489 length:231 start_codon:yes stop_codon:yes gene_type:complete